MESNLEIWEKLETTDPKYAKAFDKGTFKGTAINPTYQIKKMTELFGPCGKGWNYTVEKTEIVSLPNNEIMVYVILHLHVGTMNHVVGVGGDYILRQTKNGPRADDDAMKKATTDAICNAFKFLGMSADVYLGRYDDNKYVQSLKEPKYSGPVADGNHRSGNKIVDKAVNDALGQINAQPNIESTQKVGRFLYKELKESGASKDQLSMISDQVTNHIEFLRAKGQ